MNYTPRQLALLSLVLATACTPPPAVSPASVQPAATPAPPSFAYRIGAGDRLRVTTYNEPTLSGEFTVSGAGRIAFPLLGDIEAVGKTTEELREALRRELASKFLRNPSVAVEVVNFRPVYVLGEIAKPGEIAFAEGLTAYALIAKAGGFTYRADKRRIYIRHENEPEERPYALTSDLVIRPGDTIRIGERYF